MTIEFDDYQEFDKDTAEEGRWAEIYSANGKLFGSFLLELIHPQMPRTMRWNVANNNKRSKSNQTEAEMRDELIRFVTAVTLKDWKVTDSKGKPVAFTKDNVMAFFNHPVRQRALPQIIDQAGDVMNYQPDDEAPEKN